MTVGVIAASGAYGLLYALARPDQVPAAQRFGESITAYGGGAYKFVWYFTSAAGLAAFLITLALLNYFAKQRERHERTTPAQVV